MKKVICVLILVFMFAVAGAVARAAEEKLLEAKIEIYAEKELAVIDERIYGHFIEFLAQCIEGKLWVSEEEAKGHRLVMGGIREDVFEAIKQLDMPLLRWPGGCYSDVYHWRDGIGSMDDRPERENLHWGGIVKNAFGTDEFLRLCEALDVEPLINVNLGTGTAQEAAEWVRYVNDQPGTEMGKLRTENGRAEPYGVKLWGIGNESYGDWEKGDLTNPADYSKKYLEFYNAMKEADPEIEILAVGANRYFVNWNKVVLTELADKIDYLSLHLYYPSMEFVGMKDRKALYYALVSAAADMELEVERFEQDVLEFAGPDTKIRVALDEWNLAWRKTDSILYDDYELVGGLFTADLLMRLQRHSPRMAFANFALLLDAIPLIAVNEETWFPTPSYLAFRMLQRHSGDRLLETSVESPTFSNRAYGTIRARKKNPHIVANATTNAERDRIYLMVVNRHYDTPVAATIDIRGFSFGPEARTWELNGGSPHAKNTYEDKEAIRVTPGELSIPASPFTYTFPPHSVTSIEIKGR